MRPLGARRTADFTVVRFISHPELRRNESYLENWADRVADWLRDGTTVFFFAHCPLERKAPRVVRTFQEKLERCESDVPPLPWNELAEDDTQTNLF